MAPKKIVFVMSCVCHKLIHYYFDWNFTQKRHQQPTCKNNRSCSLHTHTQTHLMNLISMNVHRYELTKLLSCQKSNQNAECMSGSIVVTCCFDLPVKISHIYIYIRGIRTANGTKLFHISMRQTSEKNTLCWG